jgi:cobyrinic acid a,c-diamide synthase
LDAERAAKILHGPLRRLTIPSRNQLTMNHIPRITLAALRGGAGKTFISAGIAAALRKRGLTLGIFKKGPDYIDSGWLGLAAGADCYNLDSYLCPLEKVRASFVFRARGKDAAIIEGNRGLFDGVDSEGSFSTAELAKLIKSPVILIVDATKMTRTAAACVLGCSLLDPELAIKGIVLNRVAGQRHESVLRESIEAVSSIPVIGCVNKLSIDELPQRHLGLLPLYEHPRAEKFVQEAALVAEQSIDLDALTEIAKTAGPLESCNHAELMPRGDSNVSIGVLRDSAFQFYYPENLEALERLGAKLVFVSSLTDKRLPDVHALYIGGGFPETHAELLAANEEFKRDVLLAARRGLPIYAECGGLMYLSRTLQIDGAVYPMVGLFPVDTVLERKPQGHGYIQVEAVAENPFYQPGTTISGHEFHYSYVTGLNHPEARYVFQIKRGHGMDGARDGICMYNALGTYVHVHALGEPQWAQGLVKRALEFKTGCGT